MLQLCDVKTVFGRSAGLFLPRAEMGVKAVDGVSLEIAPGEIVGLVGESGCGKSTLARTIMHLVRPSTGSVWLNGTNLSALDEGALRTHRPDMQMVFQDPYASLNPRLSVLQTLAEACRVRTRLSSTRVRNAVAEALERVGLDASCMSRYPHEFSGGQRQRVAVARALAPQPRLLIADEPVSALDVSVQAQIVNLLAGLCTNMHLTMLFISHDLSVVHHLSRRIAVMYLGRIVEIGPAHDVYTAPIHPYTRTLIEAIAVPDPTREQPRRDAEAPAPGETPSPAHAPIGCAFHPRCRYAQSRCSVTRPELEACAERGDRRVACLRHDGLA
jgi:oligopeptide transport system ATP-binding protein